MQFGYKRKSQLSPLQTYTEYRRLYDSYCSLPLVARPPEQCGHGHNHVLSNNYPHSLSPCACEQLHECHVVIACIRTKQMYHNF